VKYFGKVLTKVNPALYPCLVLETTGTGFDSLNSHRRTTATRRYFFVRLPLCAFNGRTLAGKPSGLPVSDDAGLSTLSCVRPPHLTVGSGIKTAVIGGRIMRQFSHAHIGQSQLQIIRAALRDAELAPTVFDALDVTGDALRRLADIAKTEANHA
jgi:hypothetical protein